jgi:hypothetical protein
MGNGALPNGPSYRAHPRLYHRDNSLRYRGIPDIEQAAPIKLSIRSDHDREDVA